jgi:hypothetical protein
LFDVVAVREAVVAEEIAVVPEFLDDSVGSHVLCFSRIVQRRRRVERLAQRGSAG